MNEETTKEVVSVFEGGGLLNRSLIEFDEGFRELNSVIELVVLGFFRAGDDLQGRTVSEMSGFNATPYITSYTESSESTVKGQAFHGVELMEISCVLWYH